MTATDNQQRRVKFYGPHDLSVGWYVPRVIQIVEAFNANEVPTSINDALELHNIQQYLEHGLLPRDLNSEQQGDLTARIPLIRGTVARYFSEVNDTNIGAKVAGVERQFHIDLLDLLGRYKAFERCRADSALPALNATGVHLRDQLTSKRLVRAYDSEIRDALLASPASAEYLIQEYLQDNIESQIHLPKSLTPGDTRTLLADYVVSDDPNLNYTRLLATARTDSKLGIDAKLKFQAKQRSTALEADLFAEGTGFKVGWEAAIVDDQIEPDLLETDESDGLTYRYTYSRKWLEDTLDYPSILNNFLHLFEFADDKAILNLPYYPARLGVMERLIGARGKSEYMATPSTQVVDNAAQVQTILYRRFLEEKNIDLEQVIAWFCEEYIAQQYAARDFTFSPSDKETSYPQRIRHLFAEMESLASQFSMFVVDGTIDREFLMIADSVVYKEIPSLLQGKYIYATKHEEITNVLHLLFSDQSSLTYIDETTNAESGAALIARHHLTYTDFQEYQRSDIDYLIKLGVIEDIESRIQFADAQTLLILKALFSTQATSYYHLSVNGRAVIDSMEKKGWVTRRATVLTEAEADYFNFLLNAVGFTNGPQLRNKYLHGVQSNADGESTHFNAYITALKLVIALVIKINDDFCLAEFECGERRD